MKKHILLFAGLLLLAFCTSAKDYIVAFDTTGTEEPIDSIWIINITTKDTITMSPSDTIVLREWVTGINDEFKKDKSSIKVYPNPATENCKLEFIAEKSGSTSINIFDINGKCVLSQNTFLSMGKHQFSLSGLKPGLFIVRVQTENALKTGKLIFNGTEGIARLVHESESSLNTHKSATLEGDTLFHVYHTQDDLSLTLFGGGGYTVYYNIIARIRDQYTQGTTLIKYSNIGCRDADNRAYPVARIDRKYWMAQNLEVKNNNAWVYSGDGSSTTSTLRNKMGRLYDWETAQEVCPSGWHLPSKKEWEDMIEFVDDYYEHDRAVGALLKSDDQPRKHDYWMDISDKIDGDGTNSSGFNGFAGGARFWEDGSFYNMKKAGYWWCSTENPNDSSRAYFVKLSYDSDNVSLTNGANKQYGFSVRCVRD